MITKKSFLFYVSWEQTLNLLTLEERWNFIKNLINYHKGKDVVFMSKMDEVVWQGVLPALQTNNEKYERRASVSRMNGSKNKGKNTSKIPDTTHWLSTAPNGCDNSKQTNDNSKQINDNSKELRDNIEEYTEKEYCTLFDNREGDCNNEQTKSITTGETMAGYMKRKIVDFENYVITNYSLDIAEGILLTRNADDLSKFIKNNEEIEKLLPDFKKYIEYTKALF